MGVALRYPAEHGAFRTACRAAGQARPTPLLLRYRSGDFNCLHQDVYGALVFPLQVAILLSAPGRDFTGGEFVLTEQRPRMQSRAEVVSLGQGDGVVFGCASGRSSVRGARTASRSATASAASRAASDSRSGSSSTTRRERRSNSCHEPLGIAPASRASLSARLVGY